MASPDKHKIAAYLTDRENEALESLADRLSVSKSKAVAMAILAMADSDKVEIPSKPITNPQSRDTMAVELVEINGAIAKLTNQLEKLAKLPGQIEAIAEEVEAIKK